MIRAAILSLAFLITGVGTASAGECGKLCDMLWWETATQEERVAEIATADVNARDDVSRSPLHIAAEYGTPADITALLDAGANLNARDFKGATPLHGGAGADTFIALLDAGPQLNARNWKGDTPLYRVIGSGSLIHLEALLTAGADLNVKNKAGRTPLHWAALFGTPAAVIALLDAGADGRAKDNQGRTPFVYADAEEGEYTNFGSNLKGTEAYWRLNDALYD